MDYSGVAYIGVGNVPVGIGGIIKGWDITEEEFRNSTLPVVDFRAMTPSCKWDCFHCFTGKNQKTLSLSEIKDIIDQLSELGTKTINYVGEGEPTLDRDFFDIINYTSSKGITPLVASDGATVLRDVGFASRLKESGASVLLKCDSLFSADYQNWVVGDRSGTYFDQRNESIAILTGEGFNFPDKDGTTRIGFDMVVCKKNFHEAERTLRYCREQNMWIFFAYYIPSGRCNDGFDWSLALSREEKDSLQETVRKVDSEYGFEHGVLNNFLTCRCIELMCIYGDGRVTPCVGNEEVVGNVRDYKISDLRQRIIDKYPLHDPRISDGNCLYRNEIIK